MVKEQSILNRVLLTKPLLTLMTKPGPVVAPEAEECREDPCSTWSHAELVRSTQLFSKSWLGCNPLGRGNLEFHSNSVRSQSPLHFREIQTISVCREITTPINNFANKDYLFDQKSSDPVFSSHISKKPDSDNCPAWRNWRESRRKCLSRTRDQLKLSDSRV